jgi:putative flippase GtrA
MPLSNNSRLDFLLKRLIGFVNVGLLMTAISAAVLYLLLVIFNWQIYIAYSVVYLASILLSYLLNARFVFKKVFSWVHLGAYYIAYFSGMLIGISIISVLKHHFCFNDFANSCLVIPVTLIWNFLFSSIIFDRLRAHFQYPPNSSTE